MNNFIDEALNLFKQNGIENIGIIPFSKCRIINEPLLKRKGAENSKSALMYTVPYYSGEYESRNISRYAVPKDYHLFSKELLCNICAALSDRYSGYFFRGFSDHSPIDEVMAAAEAGLGVVGENRLLITEKYGSYVFIGEILTDFVPEEYNTSGKAFCVKCGKCERACPSKDVCLSKITQTKGERSEREKSLMISCNTAWGCDICQEVCPMNRGVSMTDIEFFKKDLTPVLSSDMIDNMSDDEFSERAYAWKGKNTIKNNLLLLENKQKKD